MRTKADKNPRVFRPGSLKHPRGTGEIDNIKAVLAWCDRLGLLGLSVKQLG
ncbi:MAG TPA: hypothetical protein VK211_07750 [Kamptonema sp.]|nr:hypothetical protein [Kamptonema sp.]